MRKDFGIRRYVEIKGIKKANNINWYTKVILMATFVCLLSTWYLPSLPPQALRFSRWSRRARSKRNWGLLSPSLPPLRAHPFRSERDVWERGSYHQILNNSSLNNCHNKLLENDTFPVYVLMPVNEYYNYIVASNMKNGRCFNFRDICNRNLWDTGYSVKKLQGYGILRPPLMGPH